MGSKILLLEKVIFFPKNISPKNYSSCEDCRSDQEPGEPGRPHLHQLKGRQKMAAHRGKKFKNSNQSLKKHPIKTFNVFVGNLI